MDVHDNVIVGKLCELVLPADVQNWMLCWSKLIHVYPDKISTFLSETGAYYLDFTGILGKVVLDSRVMYWSSPVIGPRMGKTNVLNVQRYVDLPDSDKLYLKALAAMVVTWDDYDAVSNHMYALQYGGPRVGVHLACCDLSGFSVQLLRGYLLVLSQKKFPPKIVVSKTVPLTVLRVDSELVKYRKKINLKLEGAQKLGVPNTFVKSDPALYFDGPKMASYFYSTAIGRLQDAVAIMSNLDEAQVVIPADGFGFFSQVARIFGKTVVSGDSSHVMVQNALDLGTELHCEDGVSTVKRGIAQFGIHVLIFLSFTWGVAREILEYCVANKYRVLVYEKYLYYLGSSLLVEYGSPILKGVKGIKWLNIPFKLSESLKYHVDKPLLTELTKGPMYFDDVKGIRQIVPYSEMYPFKLVVSVKSLLPQVELQEMSVIHQFTLSSLAPRVYLLRCPHNAQNGLNWDIDTWRLLSIPVDINRMVLGTISYQDIRELFHVALVNTTTGKASAPKSRKKRVTKPFVTNNQLVSPNNFKINVGNKYYMKSSATLTPYVRPLFDNGKVKLVWLRLNSYIFEDGDGTSKYIRYTLSI